MSFPLVTDAALGPDGTLRQYALGCYTILYVVQGKDTTLCARCATVAYQAGTPLLYSTYDEGAPVACDGEDCDALIESSYGEAFDTLDEQ